MRETDPRPESRQRRRSGGRATGEALIERSPQYRTLVNPFVPLRIFSDDQVEAIHVAALGVLERQGMRVLSERARASFRAGGAEVVEATQIVRLDRTLIARALETAPREIELAARNPERTVRIGGRHVAIAPVAGPPYVTDLDRGKRPGSLEAFRDFVCLAQSFDIIHMLAPSAEPQDVAVQERHLQTMLFQLTLSDKIPFVFCRGGGQIADCFAMLRIAHGIDGDAMSGRPLCYTVVNTNSPLQLDGTMADGIMDFAAAGQLVIITPFTLAGAMAPATIVGALTLAHAEALLGITLAQLTRPGAPVAYGSFTSNVDMKSGSPAFGTPEYTKAAFGAGQLGRYLGVPWRCSNANASNSADGQAVYESQMSLWGALLGGCNILMHGAGWLEGGLTASYEKFILDIEMLQMFAEVFAPVAASEAEMGLEAIAEVGPGGHFFGAAHTMQRYRTAFYSPLVSDWRNFGAWSEDGAKSVTTRATAVWRDKLASFVAPDLEAAKSQALADYVARRKSEGGAPPVS